MQLPRNHLLRRGAAAGVALMGSGVLAGSSLAAARPPDRADEVPRAVPRRKSRAVGRQRARLRVRPPTVVGCEEDVRHLPPRSSLAPSFTGMPSTALG
jgi:hypothetical protein